MRDYIENACEEIDAALFSGDDFLNEETVKEFEVYLDRWKKKIQEIKDDNETKRKEEEFSKYSDDELKKQYQEYFSFEPIGNLYGNIRIGFLYYAEKELRKRNINIQELKEAKWKK